MRTPTTLFLSGLILAAHTAPIGTFADDSTYYSQSSTDSDAAVPEIRQEAPAQPFSPFTGKLTKNKVRMRLLPNLDSPIIKELAQGDMLIVIGETEDFYAVQPPAGTKAFVFRTYVLDNQIEASRVNVRLEPDLDAPIIAQMRQGDKVDGTISTINNKWLEITPPPSARFYVAKDYVEKLGDSSMLSMIERKRDEVNMLLSTTYLASQTELQKPFPEINLDGVYANLNRVINEYSAFPEQVARARELISSTQDNYLQKKISYLEAKTKVVQDDWQNKNTQLNEQMKSQQQKLSQLEQQLKKSKGAAPYIAQNAQSGVSNKMNAWVPVEEALYATWTKDNGNRSQDDFYSDQEKHAVEIRGIIEPYNRVIKNKPGDYILVNQTNHLPIAYLYSTKVNLQDRVGHEVTVHGVVRDNHNFAFPAYFVLEVE